MEQNYPNPFNSQTNIKYSINKSSFVELNIYNSKGEVVRKLFNGMKEKGKYQINFNASSLSSGVYYYSLKLDNKRLATRKMLYLE